MRYRLILLFACLVWSGAATAQAYDQWVEKGHELYLLKAYKKSVRAYKKAFKLSQKDVGDLYDAACSAALCGKSEQAIKWLQLSVDAGWTNAGHMERDSDLQSIRTTPEYAAIKSQVDARLAKIEAGYNQQLRKQLLDILNRDQDVRNEYVSARDSLSFDHPIVDSLLQVMIAMDEENLKQMEVILNEHGWVPRKLVGQDANMAIFLVIQHSPYEVQKKYFPMAEQALQTGDIAKSHFAMLYDRISLAEGKMQRYGSQIGFNEETQTYYVLPLEDHLNVDQRRAEMELQSMKKYCANWDIIWDAEAFKEQQEKQ